MFVALVLISAFTFAQQKQMNSGLKAVKVLKSINNVPPTAKSVVDSLHYDGDNSDGIGTNSANTMSAFAFYPASLLTYYNANGNSITSVKVFVNGIADVTTSTIKIYSDKGITEVASQVFTAIEGWNDVVLTTPLAIPATDLYIGYQVVCTGGYPIGCDAATEPNPNANWTVNGVAGEWVHLNELAPSLTFNWNIRAMVSGSALTVPIPSCTPLAWAAGNVSLGNSSTSPVVTLKNLGGGTLTVSGITGLSAPYTTTLTPASVSLTNGQSVTFGFTFLPTVAGAINQTVVIATNSGDITFALTGTGVDCAAISTFPWSESFEGTAFPPACWTAASPDGGTGWASVAAGTTPLPGWNGGTMSVPTGGGNNAAYVTWTTGGASSNDQWLITPQLAIPAGKALFFQVFRFGSYQDFIDVKISTTNDQPASFTSTLLSLDSNSLLNQQWLNAGASLSAYAGQSIYIAFNEHVADNENDGAFIAIDLVKVDADDAVAENAIENISIFPNPANNKLYIAANQIQSVEIYNLTGAKVASYGNQNTINVSDLAQGTYLVRVITGAKVTTQKINIVR